MSGLLVIILQKIVVDQKDAETITTIIKNQLSSLPDVKMNAQYKTDCETEPDP